MKILSIRLCYLFTNTMSSLNNEYDKYISVYCIKSELNQW